jgi:formyltetrahydrofolate deformylase
MVNESFVGSTYILTLSCSQRPGIVHAVTAFLFQHGCDIVEHQQFDDTIRDALFLRTEFVSVHDVDAADLSMCRSRSTRSRMPKSA